MIQSDESRIRPAGGPGGRGESAAAGRAVALAAALALGLALGACSTMSDIGEATSDGVSKVASALNPFNWFGDSDSEEDEAQARAEQQRAVANTQPKTGVKSASRDALAQRETERDEGRYPKLSSVPERPREATSKRAEQARQDLREGLIADSANARYSDDQLRARTAPLTGAGQADAARSNERIAGEPPAQPAPTMPVTAARAAPPPAQTAAAAPPRVPRVAPPPAASASVPSRGGYGSRQAAAATAAPVAPAAPSPAAQDPRVPQRQAALAAPQTPAPAAAAPRTVLKTVQVATIYFNDGSARLSANDRRVVTQVADAARRTGGLLRIIGHSSMAAAGSDAERAALANYKVSLDRANAVARELLRQGIPGNQMQVMAEGARNPIYEETTATGAAGNRRTEIYLDFYERL